MDGVSETCPKCGGPKHEPGAWVPAEVRIDGELRGPQGFWCDGVPEDKGWPKPAPLPADYWETAE